MMETRLHFSTAGELFAAHPSIEEDLHARPAGETLLEFMDTLRRSATPEEAITYGAYMLPRRQAVWWGYQCVRRLGTLLTEQDLAMLELARQWVSEPEEALRYRCLDQGLAARDKTPGVWISLAAAWSGGSMAPPAMPRVPPSPAMTPRAINVAIHGALAKVPLADRARTLHSFMDGCLAMVAR